MKNCGFCEELLSENDFEVVLVNFCCYHCGAILRQFRRLAQATRTLLELCQLTKTGNFIATPMKNIFGSLLPAYWRYKSGFCFFPDIIKNE